MGVEIKRTNKNEIVKRCGKRRIVVNRKPHFNSEMNEHLCSKNFSRLMEYITSTRKIGSQC